MLKACLSKTYLALWTFCALFELAFAVNRRLGDFLGLYSLSHEPYREFRDALGYLVLALVPLLTIVFTIRVLSKITDILRLVWRLPTDEPTLVTGGGNVRAQGFIAWIYEVAIVICAWSFFLFNLSFVRS